MTDPVVLQRRRTDRNRRYNVAMFIVVFVTCVGLLVGGIITYVKIDGKASSTEKIVKTIRAAQVTDTSRSKCVAQTTNNAVEDVILALIDRDQNKADYKALTKCKP